METSEDIIVRQWIPNPSKQEIECVDTFKVMSYNILNDMYITEHKYRYCPEEILYMKGRHHRIVQEIAKVDAGVVCLQEVPRAHFQDNLVPDLGNMGYKGIHMEYLNPYVNNQRDGNCIFYKGGKMELLDHKPCFTQNFVSERLQESIEENETENKQAIEQLVAMCHGCLIAKFLHVPSLKKVAIGNIHIAWNRFNLPGISSVEAASAVHQLHNFCDGVPFILTGDFNSPTDFAPYSVMTMGKFDHSQDHWNGKPCFDMHPWTGNLEAEPNVVTDSVPSRSVKNYVEDSHIPSPVDLATDQRLTRLLSDVLHTNIPLKSAYKQIMGFEPHFTNCELDDWEGYLHELCLDYMWYTDKKLQPKRVLETPSREILRKYHALPSKIQPSDHVSIATEFQLL